MTAGSASSPSALAGSTFPAAAAVSAETTFGRTRDDPPLRLGERDVVIELAAEDAHLDRSAAVPGHGRRVDEHRPLEQGQERAGDVAAVGAGAGEDAASGRSRRSTAAARCAATVAQA